MKKAFVLALVVSFLGLIAVSQDAHARRNGTCPDDDPKRSAGCTDDNKAVEQIEIAKGGADDNPKPEGTEKTGMIAKGGADDNPKPEGTEKVG
jgi:hypothetical protein